jgi:hypothetical protein
LNREFVQRQKIKYSNDAAHPRIFSWNARHSLRLFLDLRTLIGRQLQPNDIAADANQSVAEFRSLDRDGHRLCQDGVCTPEGPRFDLSDNYEEMRREVSEACERDRY